MFYKKIFLSVLVLAISLISLNCNDSNSPVTQSNINISGKVFNFLNTAVPNLKINIQGRTAITASDGSFAVNDITTPYDIQVIDSASRVAYIFKGAVSSNIRIPNIEIPINEITARISGTIPPEVFQNGAGGKIMFTDGNYVNAYGTISVNGYTIDVRLTDNSPVTGKLIVLTYKVNSLGNSITSYENFGESTPLTISSGGNYNYDFTSSELSLNPGEEQINCSLTLQPGFNTDLQWYHLTFASKKVHNYVAPTQFIPINGNTFSLMLPSNLPRNYTAIFGNHAFNNTLQSLELFKIPSDSSSINLETKAPPELISPANNSTNVSEETIFSFNSGTGNGVYKVLFGNITTNARYYVFTEANSLTLSGLSEIGFGSISNSDFSWAVEKFGFNNTVNDYLTTYTDTPDYFKTNSDGRNFSTAP